MTERKLALALAIAAAAICALIVIALLFWPIPARNETLLGTVVGFIFGNMVGPVYRAVFGAPDEGSREVANRAVDALAASSPRADSDPATLPDPHQGA